VKVSFMCQHVTLFIAGGWA